MGLSNTPRPSGCSADGEKRWGADGEKRWGADGVQTPLLFFVIYFYYQ